MQSTYLIERFEMSGKDRLTWFEEEYSDRLTARDFMTVVNDLRGDTHNVSRVFRLDMEEGKAPYIEEVTEKVAAEIAADFVWEIRYDGMPLNEPDEFIADYVCPAREEFSERKAHGYYEVA